MNAKNGITARQTTSLRPGRRLPSRLGVLPRDECRTLPAAAAECTCVSSSITLSQHSGTNKKKKNINQARTFMQTGGDRKTSVHKVSLLAARRLSIHRFLYVPPSRCACVQSVDFCSRRCDVQGAEPCPIQLDLTAGQTLRNASHGKDDVFHRSATSVCPPQCSHYVITPRRVWSFHPISLL